MSRKSSVAKKEDPPKRPLSAYFLFLGEARPRIQKEHPQAKISEISQIAGQEWAKIDPTDKERFEKKHQELKKIYEKDKLAFEERNGPIKNNRKQKNRNEDENKTKKSRKSK